MVTSSTIGLTDQKERLPLGTFEIPNQIQITFNSGSNILPFLRNQSNMPFGIGSKGSSTSTVKHGFVYDSTESEQRDRFKSVASFWEREIRKEFPPSPVVTPPPRVRQESIKSVDKSIMSSESKPAASPSVDSSTGGIPHVYHDYSKIPDGDGFVRKKTGGVTRPFPEKMHDMLSCVEKDEMEQSIVSWLPHGRAFIVRIPIQFTKMIMPKYFKQTKLTSFQRQLNLYGFRRITQGPDAGAYYHELFLKGRPALSQRMIRQKVKGTGHKQPADAKTEPNFYQMSPILDSTSEVVSSLMTSSSQSHHQIPDTEPTSPMAAGLSAFPENDKPRAPLLPSDSYSTRNLEYRKRSDVKWNESSNLPPSGQSFPNRYASSSPSLGSRSTNSGFESRNNKPSTWRNLFLSDDIEASPGLQNAAYLLRGIAAGARSMDEVTRLSMPTDNDKCTSSQEQFDDVTDASGSWSTSSEGPNSNASFYQLLQPRFSAPEFPKQDGDGNGR